jgi:hypothetical protein
MLEERRDASARFAVINAEKERIGSVRILYEIVEGKVTEKRIGISVTPQDSSLAKLFAAYTAMGGNPFDISMFAAPDRSVAIDEVPGATMPSGGVLHPQDIKYAYDQGVTDGDGSLLKYKTSRIGGKHVTSKEFEILGIIQRGRKWITAEIRHKRTRLEEMIIKLCDLREQLDEEVSDMLWATYGDMIADHGYEPERFTDSLTAANIAYFFDSTFRVPDKKDPTSVPVDNTAAAGEAGSVNIDVLGGYESLISDEDNEDNSAL